jgi:hypothetical protein
MKKLALLSLLITLVSFGYAQSQRMVMLEHFTQASCGPCATANPTIHSRLTANADKMTSINYHVSWPGYDPMYLHNTEDVNARVSYYGVSGFGVPYSVIDGNVYTGHPNGWTGNMSIVTNRYAVPSPFTLSINQRLSATNDTIFVTMLVEATSDVTGPITAYMGVIEKHIHFNTAPGSNGEKDFYNVFKKMLPSKTGISLPTPMHTGEYAIIESYWVLANVYTLSELSVVSFIQNPTTKEIYQSGNLQLAPITAVYDADVEATKMPNSLDRYCNSSIAPLLDIRNNGNNDLTNLSIKYQINNEEIHTYQWNGNLAFLDKAQLELPEITYTMQDTNVLKIYVDQVNQGLDEYTKNDTLVQQFYSAHKVGRNLQLKLRTDNAPAEVTWEIKNSNGETVVSGGPYSEVMTLITENITIDNDDCYDFFIHDAAGNGLCCGNGAGFFRLAPASGNPIIAQGTQFGSEVWAQFEVFTVGTENLSLSADLKVYPNPASNNFIVEVPGTNSSYNISVLNQTGQKVFESNGSASKLEINTNNWSNGLYIVRVESKDGIRLSKINILK